MKIILSIIILEILNVTQEPMHNPISLLEMNTVQEYLSLTEKQYTTIHAAVEKIKAVLHEDKKIIEGLKTRIMKGDEPGFFEKISVKRGRGGRIDAIEDLIREIENQLNEEQKIKFSGIEKPALKNLEKKEIFRE